MSLAHQEKDAKIANGYYNHNCRISQNPIYSCVVRSQASSCMDQSFVLNQHAAIWNLSAPNTPSEYFQCLDSEVMPISTLDQKTFPTWFHGRSHWFLNLWWNSSRFYQTLGHFQFLAKHFQTSLFRVHWEQEADSLSFFWL